MSVAAHPDRPARRPLRRLAAVAAVTTLALPLSVVGVGGAVAASQATLVDRGWGPYGAPYGNSQPSGYPTTTSSTAQLDTTTATSTQATGLVEITSTVDFGAGEAAGTGMVIGSNGIVVTNHHVVAGATDIEVTDVSTGQTYQATVVGTDSVRDVAVLRLQGASGLTTITADRTGVALHTAVTSVGDAGGDGGSLTAAAGRVTDAHHSIKVQDDAGGTSRLHDLVQIDADIIPGDSGGALLDAAGDVVGMNVAASSGSATITGYAIPIARVLRISGAILAGDASGAVEIGYDAFLGVELATGSSGATLAGVVADGPAERVGLGSGDTVTSLGGTSVTSRAQLRRLIAGHQPGERVTVSWTGAGGVTHAATVRLGRAPVA